MTCSLSDKELTEFFQYLRRLSTTCLRKMGAVLIARQPKSEEWIVTPSLNIDSIGNISSNMSYVWLGHLLSDDDSKGITVKVICPSPQLPLSTEGIHPLINAMKTCLKHNFLSGLLTMASALMTLHYECILKVFDGCSIPFVYGPSMTGKSTSVRCALSLLGMQKWGFFKKSTSTKWFYDRCCRSTLPFTIDDPSANQNALISDFINDVYDGGVVVNLRSGANKPIPFL